MTYLREISNNFQAFRLTNNNDLPANVALPPGGITLPDVLTESDLFMNLDTSSLLLPSINLESDSKRPGTIDFGSQLLPDTQRLASQEPARLEDHTLLDLDLGEDDAPLDHDISIEVGRDAPLMRPVEEDLFSEEGKLNDVDLNLDLGEDDAPLGDMDIGEDSRDNVDHLHKSMLRPVKTKPLRKNLMQHRKHSVPSDERLLAMTWIPS